jgi:UDP-N-acetylglucosamine 4,6-dehydratase
MIGSATWLLCGGAGFFGRAFTRYLLDHAHPHAVRIFSRSESRQALMHDEFQDARLRFLLGDIKDADRLAVACRGVDFVVHAAAAKRIDACEANPWETTLVNVVGTQQVARACLTAGVQRAIFLGTDKSAAPHTTYGAQKLLAERLWNQSNVYAAGTPTRFACTRYGNVLSSTGSVIPTWRAELATGTITVTEPTATRFVMTGQDASRLVLQAFECMAGGEVFLPKLRATDVATLAKVVAPGCQWRVTGLRPTEKLHEELLSADELPHARDVGGVYVLRSSQESWSDVPSVNVGLPLEQPYRSDLVPRVSEAELAEMVACG